MNGRFASNLLKVMFVEFKCQWIVVTLYAMITAIIIETMLLFYVGGFLFKLVSRVLII